MPVTRSMLSSQTRVKLLTLVMGIAFLLLGLLPLMFLPDLLDGSDDDEDSADFVPPANVPINDENEDQVTSLLDEPDILARV